MAGISGTIFLSLDCTTWNFLGNLTFLKVKEKQGKVFVSQASNCHCSLHLHQCLFFVLHYLLLSAEVTDISIMLPKETSRAIEWQFLDHLKPDCFKGSINLVSVALTVANLIEKMVFIHHFSGFGPVICLSVLWCEIILFAVFVCELFQKLLKAWCSCYTTDLLW